MGQIKIVNFFIFVKENLIQKGILGLINNSQVQICICFTQYVETIFFCRKDTKKFIDC